VTKEEWNEYYTNVSSSIDRDDYFELMMNNAWKMGEAAKTYASGWSNTTGAAPPQRANDSYGQFYQNASTGAGIQRSTWLGYRPQTTEKPHYDSSALQQTSHLYGGQVARAAPPTAPYGTSSYGASPYGAPQPTAPAPVADTSLLLKTFRETIARRGARGIFGIARNFRIIDDDNSKTLSWAEFNKCLNDFRVPIAEEDRKRLFQAFDLNGDGSVDYEEFLRGVVGEMNEFRKGYVRKAFAILDKDGSGVVDTSDLKGVYNGSKHPDVIQGKKTEDEVLMEWLETFEQHYASKHGGAPDGKVTAEEFEEYYTWVSMSIDLDSYF
jgi:Ca2+-binding EF-hand superfamily protein